MIKVSCRRRIQMIHKGQIYEPLEDIEVTCMVAFSAPGTGGYKRMLPKGERFRISHEPLEGKTAVYADPLNYRKLEKQMVKRGDRWRFLLYAGYYLCIYLEAIREKCRLVEDAD